MKYRIFIGVIVAEMVILLLFYAAGGITALVRADEVRMKKDLVAAMRLTDFSIWTEARYTRHPSQADIFTPFQESPSSVDHFPSGSIMAPGNLAGMSRRPPVRRESP